jgi:zinc transport system substrate-binding protein
MKKWLSLLLACLMMLPFLPAAAESAPTLSIVATIYPQYDFARAVVGDTGSATLTMLLKPGADMHAYEPTPQDIIAIRNADLFVYVGGESDAWVADILDSMPDSDVKAVSLTGMVDTLAEEHVEGMEVGEEESGDAGEEEEMDEHVWTAPLNAAAMVDAICVELSALAPAYADSYRANADAYIAKLQALDEAFREVVASGKRTEVIFGDRFPMRYFTHAYGLTYYAAFPGCSAQTNPARRPSPSSSTR